MLFPAPFKKLLHRAAALLGAAVIVFSGVPAAAVHAPDHRIADADIRAALPVDSGERELILSLDELKAQADSDEFIPHVWPVIFGESGFVSSFFGSRVDPVTGETLEFHQGIDLADKPNTKIHAAASGTIVEADDYGGYGLTLLIDHGNGYQTRYSHCSSFLVDVGDEVTQGQIIATMGATGKVTGVHCDFRIYLDGTAIDPLTVLDEAD